MTEYKNLSDGGIALIYQGKHQEAIRLISKSIELKNDWEISYFYRAVANQANEQMDEAMDAIKYVFDNVLPPKDAEIIKR